MTNTDVSITPILDNIRAAFIAHGTFDGKRGSTWTPSGSAHYYNARCEYHTTTPDSIGLTISGDVVRGESTYGYTPGLEVQIRRWSHGCREGIGSFISVHPPQSLPDGARNNIIAQVAELIENVRTALEFGDTEHDDARFLEALWHEASLEALRHAAERAEDEAHRATVKAVELRAQLDSGQTWPEYGIQR